MSRRRYKAKVKFEIVAYVDDVWGDDCSMGQIERQACEAAQHALSRLLRPEEWVTGAHDKATRYRIFPTSKGEIVAVEIVPEKK